MFRQVWRWVCLAMAMPVMAETLAVVGDEEGLVPYYYGPELTRGLLVDVLDDFAQSTGIDAHFHASTTRRFEWDLKEGRANAMFGNPAWFPVQDQLHLIGPLFYWRDRLFAQPELSPESLDRLEGSICLRKDFTYSEALEARLDTDLIRFNAYNADQLVRMFLRDRCDYAIMDDLEFRFLALQGDMNPKLYETSIIEAEWPVYLGIIKDEQQVIDEAEAYFTPGRFEFEDRWRELVPPPDSN